MAGEIRRWVLDGPAAQGLDRADWTHAELADHLKKIHGLTASRSAMQRFCCRHGIRPDRPTYRHSRGYRRLLQQPRPHVSYISPAEYQGYWNRIVRPGNGYMHVAGANPAGDHEALRLLNEMYACLTRVLGL
jgi:hypothetical protein